MTDKLYTTFEVTQKSIDNAVKRDITNIDSIKESIVFEKSYSSEELADIEQDVSDAIQYPKGIFPEPDEDGFFEGTIKVKVTYSK